MTQIIFHRLYFLVALAQIATAWGLEDLATKKELSLRTLTPLEVRRDPLILAGPLEARRAMPRSTKRRRSDRTVLQSWTMLPTRHSVIDQRPPVVDAAVLTTATLLSLRKQCCCRNEAELSTRGKNTTVLVA